MGQDAPPRFWSNGAMARNAKLTDRDLARLRALRAEGWSLRELATKFDISRQHAGRLVRGEQRPMIANLPTDAIRVSTSAAVEAFLADAELNAGDEVLAAMARALAAKLDAATASDA